MLCLVRRLRILTSPLVRRRRSDDLERSGSSSPTTPRGPHTPSSRRPPARQQRCDRRSSRQRWSRWQGCRVERRREGLGRRVEIPSRRGPSPTSRSRPLEITKIAILSRGERSVGGGGAARAPHAPPNSRRRNDRRQIAPITSSPGPTCRSRPPEITEIASSSRDEGAVGGGGAVRAPKGVSRRLIMTLDLLAQKSRSSQRFWCNAASLATSLTHPPAPTRP